MLPADHALTQAPHSPLYDTAKRALAQARSIDEVKKIRDQAVAMEEYARQAKDRDMEADAMAIRMRATRMLGQMMQAQKQTVGLATGGEHGGRAAIDGVRKTPSIIRPTLAMQGIDKNLAKEARALGALSDEQFEKKETEARDAATSAVGKVMKSIALPKEETTEIEAKDEITLAQWKAMSAAERRKWLDPENFPSDVKFNTQDSDGIDWAQKSWNPIVGCKHNCPYCWAKDTTLRFHNAFPHGFEPVFRPRMLNAPRNTPVPPEAAFDGRFNNVFTGGMTDMFGRWLPPEWIEAVLKEVREYPRWIHLLLTKFPQRAVEFEIPNNAWIGTTVDLQDRVANAEAAFATLRERNPDGVFFLSIEPMLEPIKFNRLELFNWMIIGGASRSMRTPEWRPPHRWINDLIAQADAVGCKIFEKTNLRGNRILELPFDAPIKTDYPQVAPDVFHYLGKKNDRAGSPARWPHRSGCGLHRPRRSPRAALRRERI